MVKIKSELARSLPEPVEGKTYTIVNVEVIKTAVRGFDGVRVTLKDAKGNEYATMLWIRDRVGENSKLGAFLKVLGDDTDTWVGKKIRIQEWRPRQRTVVLIE